MRIIDPQLILAGGILGFRTADRFLVFAPSPRSCCDVWLVACLLSARSFYNSSAHKLLPIARARPSLRGDFWCFVCLVWCFWCVFCLVLAFGLWFLFFVCFAPLIGLVGLHNGLCSLLTPNEGICCTFAQFVQWHKHCVTTWREPRRRRTEKKIKFTLAGTSTIVL